MEPLVEYRVCVPRKNWEADKKLLQVTGEPGFAKCAECGVDVVYNASDLPLGAGIPLCVACATKRL